MSKRKHADFNCVYAGPEMMDNTYFDANKNGDNQLQNGDQAGYPFIHSEQMKMNQGSTFPQQGNTEISDIPMAPVYASPAVFEQMRRDAELQMSEVYAAPQVLENQDKKKKGFLSGLFKGKK